MPHIRKQIRDALITRLTGLATTGTKIYRSRVYPLAEGKLPGIVLYTNSEQVDYLTMRLPRTEKRVLSVSVEIYVKGIINYDDTLDEVCLEIESAIYSDVTLGGLAKDTQVISFNSEYNGDGDQPICVGKMDIQVTYSVLENSSATAV
jgi:hypothetical protein